MSGGIRIEYREGEIVFSSKGLVDGIGDRDVKYLIIAEIGETRPLSYLTEHAEDILDQDGQGIPIRIKDCLRLSKNSDIHPSFRRQMSAQIKNKLEELVGMDLSDIYFIIPANYYREPDHYRGWSYRTIELWAMRPYIPSVHLMLKWRSLDKNREYINMDEQVGKRDVEFDFYFDSEPIKLRERVCGNPDHLCKLIREVKENSLPKKKKSSHKTVPFKWEITENCGYPDMIFALYFPEKATPKLTEQVESEFVDFMENWNAAHTDRIHNIMNAEDVLEACDENAVQMIVDFGNCDPKVIEKLIQHLQGSDLGIERAIIS